MMNNPIHCQSLAVFQEDPIEIGITFNSESEDGDPVSVKTTAGALYSDWYGECDMCPPNDAPVHKAVFHYGGSKVVLENIGFFEDLMDLITPHIIVETMKNSSKKEVLLDNRDGLPRYFLGRGAAIRYVQWLCENDDNVKSASVVKACGVCENCGQPVFQSSTPGKDVCYGCNKERVEC